MSALVAAVAVQGIAQIPARTHIEHGLPGAFKRVLLLRRLFGLLGLLGLLGFLLLLLGLLFRGHRRLLAATRHDRKQ